MNLCCAVQNKFWCLPNKRETLTQCCFDAGPPSSTSAQHQNNIWSMSRVCCVADLGIYWESIREWTPTFHTSYSIRIYEQVLRRYTEYVVNNHLIMIVGCTNLMYIISIIESPHPTLHCVHSSCVIMPIQITEFKCPVLLRNLTRKRCDVGPASLTVVRR